jgi:hypothetical protein
MNDSRWSWTTLREAARRRRDARAVRQRLAAELASYDNPAQIDDLLARLDGQSGPDAEHMRTVLTANMRLRQIAS